MDTPRVFISHSHHDEDFTVKFVTDLTAAGAQVWVDVANIKYGDFMKRIGEGLHECEWVIMILTQNALDSSAVQMEINAALEQARLHHIKKLFFVTAGTFDPIRMSPLWLPIHRYDAVTNYDKALQQIIHALGLQSTSVKTSTLTPTQPVGLSKTLHNLGFTLKRFEGVEAILPPLKQISEGWFLMGSDLERDVNAYDDEMPFRQVHVKSFSMAVFPVTVAEYAKAVNVKAVNVPRRWELQTHLDYPITNISWKDGIQYAEWLSKVTGERWRIPTEAEWEKAARGVDGRIYPWGDVWDTTRSNARAADNHSVVTIGKYPEGVSPYSIQDMAGNIWEWCSTKYKPYPYIATDGREEMHSNHDHRVVRGGGYSSSARSVRCAYRGHSHPQYYNPDRGFRLVKDE